MGIKVGCSKNEIHTCLFYLLLYPQENYKRYLTWIHFTGFLSAEQMSRGETENKDAKSKLEKGNNDVTRDSGLSSNVKRNK